MDLLKKPWSSKWHLEQGVDGSRTFSPQSPNLELLLPSIVGRDDSAQFSVEGDVEALVGGEDDDSARALAPADAVAAHENLMDKSVYRMMKGCSTGE